MAKWGEGDPRWIVEERADATNVNNWHWTEKNATAWSKDKLKELLTGCKFENDEFSVRIKEVTKLEGEASANNRKAKLIFFYEWVINGEWEATVKNSENKTVYKGNFEMPNFSEEYSPDEVDIGITIKESKQAKLKEFVRTEGVSQIRAQLARYLQSLKEEFSQGLILPVGKEGALAGSSGSSSNLKNGLKTAGPKVVPPATTTTSTTTSTTNAINEAVKIQTKKLTMTEEFKCRANELYQVFTDINMVRAFTQNSVVSYDAQKGGKFALFDSNITGSFVEFVPNKKISMLWRNKRWPDEHYSVVGLEFTEKEDCTILSLIQTGVPANFVENTQDGWRNFYFNSIRQTFGFGSRLF